MHKNHKEMDAILFWENEQIQTSKNITVTAQTPFTTIEVAGCHGEEAGCRDSSQQLCSLDHAHQVSPFRVPTRFKDSSTRY